MKAGAGAAVWTLFDGLGSLVALEDGAGSLSAAVRYDGYGQTLATGGGPAGPWRYRGLLDLAPAGGAPLYDMAARVYAPSAGAFTQADSHPGSSADPASMNRFLYAQANPTMLVDPTGHYATVCVPGDGCTPDGRRVTGGRGGTGSTGSTATPSTHTHGNSGVNASSDSRPGVARTTPIPPHLRFLRARRGTGCT